jgi:hypothetical protein
METETGSRSGSATVTIHEIEEWSSRVWKVAQLDLSY